MQCFWFNGDICPFHWHSFSYVNFFFTYKQLKNESLGPPCASIGHMF